MVFKKGHVPHNKGTKGIIKPNSGSFKKGMIPHNKGTKGIIKPNSGSFKKGNIPWAKGKKGIMKPNSGSFKKGQKMSDETRAKMRIDRNRPERKKLQMEVRSKLKFPSKDSKPELLVQSILKKNHVGFKKHKSFKLSKSYHQADVVVEPDKVIEVFGDYWHFNPKIYDGESEQKQRRKKILAKDVWKYDEYVINEMKKQGYKVLVVWESELNKKLEQTTKKILEFISAKKS